MRNLTLGLVVALSSVLGTACNTLETAPAGAKSTKLTLVRTDLQPCGQANTCPSGQSCVRYQLESGNQLLCVDSGKECEPIVCESPGRCLVLLSSPPQLGCMFDPREQ